MSHFFQKDQCSVRDCIMMYELHKLVGTEACPDVMTGLPLCNVFHVWWNCVKSEELTLVMPSGVSQLGLVSYTFLDRNPA